MSENDETAGTTKVTDVGRTSEHGSVLVLDGVMVEWTNLGEGNNGDYDENDPDDKNLLRFDVSQFKVNEYAQRLDSETAEPDWCEVRDASYCTQVRADTPRDELQRLLQVIMNDVGPDVRGGMSIKRQCEALSWMDADYGKASPTP